jgi:hypothetical protein
MGRGQVQASTLGVGHAQKALKQQKGATLGRSRAFKKDAKNSKKVSAGPV